jgi:hypothetical protein
MGMVVPFTSLGINAEYGLMFRLVSVDSETGVASLDIICAKTGDIVGNATHDPATGDIDGSMPDLSLVHVEVKKQFLVRGDMVRDMNNEARVVLSADGTGIYASTSPNQAINTDHFERVGHVDPATLPGLPEGYVFE